MLTNPLSNFRETVQDVTRKPPVAAADRTTETMIQVVRETIGKHFPKLWPAVDLGLSTCATLLLEDNANPMAVIYVGPPSGSKTTVADMFAGATVGSDLLCYRSDNFTPAAFVSHAANVRRERLPQVDLLPRLRHRVLVTPELALIFRGKEDELAKRFSVLTRVLDGQGLTTDSGTHGQRGYEGDYLFAWLGCTTPLEQNVWKVMAQLGSRLFFFEMDHSEEVKVADLIKTKVPYKMRLADCKQVVHEYLDHLFRHHGGVRGVQWQPERNPATVIKWIARCALLLARMRTHRSGEDAPPAPELPHRAHAVLYNLARGHALVHGRQQLSADDLPVVARVTLSSMPTKRREVFLALVQNKGESLTVAQVQAALEVQHPNTARRVMGDLDWLGIMEYLEEGTGQPARLGFRPGWSWCAKPPFRKLLRRRVR